MMPTHETTSKPQSESQTELQPLNLGFANTYARLPERFFARVNPVKVAAPSLIKLNTELATHLGLDPVALATQQGAAIFSGNSVAAGSEPLAIAYAGHQFGHFVPQLGDGRANLLGELVAADGHRYDVQLKGSGPTPFSRRGDGRAALGPVLREYLLSEAMHALGVPTTRALAAVTTGEKVFREGPTPGCIFTRVAASHLRVGTFQYFAAREDVDGLRVLADYAMRRHYPEASDNPRPYRTFLEGVINRQAHLVAQWMCLGFIHGVMNTDNSSISGETIDYGPCAFMEAFHPDMVFSSIDQQGRYAYSNQPNAIHWNLTRLAESLLPLLEEESGDKEAGLASAIEALATFAPEYDAAILNGMRCKLGITEPRDTDDALIQDLLQRMADNQADYTLTFRHLCDAAENPAADASVRSLFADPTAFDAWAIQWHRRLDSETDTPAKRAATMRSANPAFIPRNHRVEAVIQAAVNRNDFTLFEELLEVTSRPYEDRTEFAHYTIPAQPHERVTQTFCGT
jgi:uncharacterized protein YdiU (UPF0061 family)